MASPSSPLPMKAIIVTGDTVGGPLVASPLAVLAGTALRGYRVIAAAPRECQTCRSGALSRCGALGYRAPIMCRRPLPFAGYQAVGD